MKTDFPRGPTLPLRSIGLENPKWPDSRDKKGPLSRGPERKSEGSFALCIPNPLPGSYVRAPPPGSGRGHSLLAVANPPWSLTARCARSPALRPRPSPSPGRSGPPGGGFRQPATINSKEGFSEAQPSAPPLYIECPKHAWTARGPQCP